MKKKVSDLFLKSEPGLDLGLKTIYQNLGD
jgi:hypothetical protein